ncbi:hypothetical protein ACHAXR_007153 [Thalassiosira sp. AJA248-18]
MVASATSGNFLSSTAHQLKKRFPIRKDYFLAFFIIKAICSLVMLNFYMGSQISIVKLEDSLSMMIHHNGKVSSGGNNTMQNTFAKAPTNVQVDTKQPAAEIINNKINQTKRNYVGMITPNVSDGTLQGKERLWNILQTRNVTQVDADYWASIPTWDTILKNIHHDKGGNDINASPIIHGLETCQAFQNITSSIPSQRRIAPAGLFNTGTNLLSVLLEYNCQNPHRVEKFGNAKRGHGNEWEVPWGKHTPASSRGRYFKNEKLKYTVDEVLPIVLVRNPYGWMKSMCRNPYTAKWKGMHDKKTCPQLKDTTTRRDADGEEWNNVDVKYGSSTTHHQSLGNLWNDWYSEYFYNNNNNTDGDKTTDAPFPRLIIRFEDIIFFPYEVTKQICTCAGGVLGHRQEDRDVANGSFHYVVRSAKAGIGHGPASQRNGLIDSWARYGSDDPKDAYSEEEVRIAEGVLDSSMIDAFGYR